MKNEFIERLVPILQKTKRIEELDLSGNNITDEGFICLCPYISGNITLKSLNLNYNKFVEVSTATAFSQAL